MYDKLTTCHPRAVTHVAMLAVLLGVSGCASIQDQPAHLARASYDSHATATHAIGAHVMARPEPYRATAAYASGVVATPSSARGQADSGVMPIGNIVPAPMGFLELCSRSPADCAHSSRYDAAEIQTAARTAIVEKVNMAFGRSSPAQGAAVPYPVMTVAAISGPPSPSPAFAADPRPSGTALAPRYLAWPSLDQPFTVSALPDLALVAAPSVVAIQVPSAEVPLQAPPATPPATPLAAVAAPVPVVNLAPRDNGWGPVDQAPVHAAWQRIEPMVIAAYADPRPGAIAADAPRRLTWNAKAPDQSLVVRSVETVATPATPDSYSRPVAPPPASHAVWRAYTAPAVASVAAPGLAVAEARPDYSRIAFDSGLLNLLRSANDTVNRTMISDTDSDVYGTDDYWAAPALRPGVRGDCEDFVLEKRRLLIENGVPAGALSIAIVRTWRDEDHAVLIVSTTGGDYVLDNLAYGVKPWRKADYTWVSRQAPGDGLGWVSLAPANLAPGTQSGEAQILVAYAR